MQREIPLFTLDGVKDAEVTTHYIFTEDKLGLSALRFQRGGAGEAILIIHGLTTSTDMYIMPEHYNLVSYLLDNGYNDVWCLDYRMSNRHSYNLFKHRYTMDDVALYDYKPTLELMRQHIGDKPIHVICHCLGANSFTMALFAKVIDGVSSVIANSVALTPRVPTWSNMKLMVAPDAVEYVLGFPYLNPRWEEDPGLTRGKIFARLVDVFHRECDVSACHMLSLMWGSGWPALYSHSNLADVTHRRGGDLYGATSMNYYRHVRKQVKAGRAVKYSNDPQYAALPEDYFAYAKDIETPVLFMTGADNKVFSNSNIVCYERLQGIVPGRHELHVFPGYGHQDPFMGDRVDRDIFPRLLEFIEKHRTAEAQRFETTAAGAA
ncbi:MAG: alpha/beta hydrolase [Actinomycetota bacterium]|nr:alpha/beta hydrolase [Actinomycetota bacterium]MDQ6945312.1 alpha/beta hydrolase [Actinomycetota bacterium]